VVWGLDKRFCGCFGKSFFVVTRINTVCKSCQYPASQFAVTVEASFSSGSKDHGREKDRSLYAQRAICLGNSCGVSRSLYWMQLTTSKPTGPGTRLACIGCGLRSWSDARHPSDRGLRPSLGRHGLLVGMAHGQHA